MPLQGRAEEGGGGLRGQGDLALTSATLSGRMLPALWMSSENASPTLHEMTSRLLLPPHPPQTAGGQGQAVRHEIVCECALGEQVRSAEGLAASQTHQNKGGGAPPPALPDSRSIACGGVVGGRNLLLGSHILTLEERCNR